MNHPRIAARVGFCLATFFLLTACSDPKTTSEPRMESRSHLRSETEIWEWYMQNGQIEIRELAKAIQGKEREKVWDIISERLGPPHRDVGSGWSIPQWDVFGGVFTYHDGAGPDFADQKLGVYFKLLRTTNSVKENLLGGYEMMTLEDSYNTHFWLGNIKFEDNLTYVYTDSGSNLKHRGAQSQNFFMLHSNGTVGIRYAEGIGPDTLLEDLPEPALIAHFTFTSVDGKTQATYQIISSGRNLTFTSDEPLSFEMYRSWNNWWN